MFTRQSHVGRWVVESRDLSILGITMTMADLAVKVFVLF